MRNAFIKLENKLARVNQTVSKITNYQKKLKPLVANQSQNKKQYKNRQFVGHLRLIKKSGKNEIEKCHHGEYQREHQALHIPIKVTYVVYRQYGQPDAQKYFQPKTHL